MNVATKRTVLRWRDPTLLVVTIAAVVVTLMSGSNFWVITMTTIGLYTVSLIGLDALVGLAGQVSFAQPTFMAVGGYGFVLLAKDAGWNPWLAMLGAAVVAALVSLVVAIPLLRLRGPYLAVGTFTLALGTGALIVGAKGITGGASGIAAVPQLSLPGLKLSNPATFCALVWVVVGVSMLAVFMLRRSFVGRAWRALGSREDVAISVGIPIARYKVLAFVVSGVTAAISGSLFVTYTSFVSPDMFDTAVAINIFLMLFFGGRGAIFGPVIGAAAIVLLPQWLSGTPQYQTLIFNFLLLGILMIRPQGVLGRDNLSAPLSTLLPTPALKWWYRRMDGPIPAASTDGRSA